MNVNVQYDTKYRNKSQEQLLLYSEMKRISGQPFLGSGWRQIFGNNLLYLVENRDREREKETSY